MQLKELIFRNQRYRVQVNKPFTVITRHGCFLKMFQNEKEADFGNAV